MTTSQRLDAKQAAENVLDAAWDTDRYPVDPFQIAKVLDVDFQLLQIPEDVSGMLYQVPGQRPVIFVDVDDHPRRRRFTVAHELGHLIERRLHREPGDEGSIAFVDRRGDLATRGTDPHEIFANEFAANLLMPEVAVRALNRMSTVSLARFFDVSVIAMEHRLNNLGIRR